MSRTFLESFHALDADIYCLQETKLQEGDGGLDIPGFHQYWNYAQRKGYSGTALLTMREPAAVYSGLHGAPFDSEGRVITAEFSAFYLVNCYAPNAAADLSRLPERVHWHNALLTHIKTLDADKPVILCGDLNAAYNEADLIGKGQGMHVPGYTSEERGAIAALIQNGFADAYRHFHPEEKAGAFAYRRGIRAVGLDYFLISERLLPRAADCRVYNRMRGSDHWPLELVMYE